MKFHIETRALVSDPWSRLSGEYKVDLVFNIARSLAATGLEVRIFDETGNQVFQHRKAPGHAKILAAKAASAERNCA